MDLTALALCGVMVRYITSTMIFFPGFCHEVPAGHQELLAHVCFKFNCPSGHYVGIICGPILLIWTSISGDLETTMKFPNLFSPGFQVIF